MILERPEFLYAGLAVTFFYAVLSVYLDDKKSKRRKFFLTDEMLEKMNCNINKIKRRYRLVFSAIAVLLIFVSAANPQWGLSWAEKAMTTKNILFCLDVSRSMLSEDVYPNRLSQAKSHIRRGLNYVKPNRAGLLLFAGEAFTYCPFTADYDFFHIMLEDASPASIERGGTSFEIAVKEAANVFDRSRINDRHIVFISDGEITEGEQGKAIMLAKEHDITVSAIGIGTREGGKVRIAKEQGSYEYISDDAGNPVIVRMDDESLKNMALTTGGRYILYDANTDDIRDFYNNIIGEERYGYYDKEYTRIPTSRYRWFIIPAVLLLVFEYVLTYGVKRDQV